MNQRCSVGVFLRGSSNCGDICKYNMRCAGEKE